MGATAKRNDMFVINSKITRYHNPEDNNMTVYQSNSTLHPSVERFWPTCSETTLPFIMHFLRSSHFKLSLKMCVRGIADVSVLHDRHITPINHTHNQMHTTGLQTLHKFSYTFRRRCAILSESQIPRSTSTNTSIWEVLMYWCFYSFLPSYLRFPEDGASARKHVGVF
jgi:hypothetical protein